MRAGVERILAEAIPSNKTYVTNGLPRHIPATHSPFANRPGDPYLCLTASW
jgi:hypothetical protein